MAQLDNHHSNVYLAKKAAKYALLPGIMPRIRGIGLNFGFLAYLMALVFVAVRLLPPHHPFFTQNRDINSFTLPDVFGEAGRHLEFTWRKADQVIMFFLLTVGTCLMLLQFVAVVMALIAPVAEAATFSLNFTDLFAVNPPTNDIAFQLLDKTFAVPNFFNSEFDPNNYANVPAFQKALFGLFKFYNNAMMVVAMGIIMYFVVVVVLETAQTGTPFGKRFASVYVPIRLVVAVGLMLPLSYGLSTGQFLTLHVAKYGSGLATNSWKAFNTRLTNGVMYSGAESVAKPQPGNLTALVEFVHLAHACRAAYAANPIDGVQNVDLYIVRNGGTRNGTAFPAGAVLATSKTYAQALEYNNNTNIQFVFGAQGQGEVQLYPGQVFPACGEMTLTVDSTAPGALQVSTLYYDTVKNLWANAALRSYGERVAKGFLGVTPTCDVPFNSPYEWGQDCAVNKTPGASYYRQMIDSIQSDLNAGLTAAISTLRASDVVSTHINDETMQRGWAGAAMLYNDLAFLNGSIATAVFATPNATRLPAIMREAYDLNNERGTLISGADMFRPGDGENWTNKQKIPFAQMYHQIKDDFSQDSVVNIFARGGNGNVLYRMFNWIFGSWGLFDLFENREVHPLASLASLGKSMIESALRNLGIGLGLSLGGSGLGNLFGGTGDDDAIKAGVTGISGIFFTLFSISLTAGFIMYYIVPFMPFMYFFFSAVRWVGAIFEAMVAIPLWGMAHLRIDGDGIPGKAAANGYFLLLDIFLRPILTLLGFVAAISLFSALAVVLHDIFRLALHNLTGFNGMEYDFDPNATTRMVDVDYYRSYLDQFFFTITYAVLMYILASSTFKIIDAIPNNTLRFIGAGIQSFSDTNEDPAQTLVQYGAIAGSSMASDLGKDLQDGAYGLGRVFRGMGGDGQGDDFQPPSPLPPPPPIASPPEGVSPPGGPPGVTGSPPGGPPTP
jgi:conjugal transfer/type IV secretion protein DotA/TraY